MRALLVFLFLTAIVGAAFGADDFQVGQSCATGTADKYTPDEIVVKFKEGVAVSQAKAALAERGATIVSTNAQLGFHEVRIPADRSVEEMVALYKNRPDVEYAEPNYVASAFMTPNDPYYSYQWHMPMVKMPAAWDQSTGSGVVVAVIDCGVAYENYGVYALAPDLAGTSFTAGYDYINYDSHPNDDCAHGTHVAGTVAQTTNNSLGVTGVAYNCTIMPVKVLDAAGNGTHTAIANGITYAADHGADVINLSLGGPTGSTTLQNAITYAYNAGVTIVAAAGNAGTSAPQYPAAYTQCISVSAVRYDKTKPSYSSYGSTIDICAPGGDVSVDQNGDGYPDGVLQQTHNGTTYTTFGYYFYEGTSMASPHVAGVAALLIAKNGGSMSPSEVRAALQNTAEDLGTSGWDQYYGYGLVNADAALQSIGGGGSAPVANFSASPTSGTAPLTVQFTDLSTNSPTSWSWTFGDGGTSTAKNPSHIYSSSGTYTVTLTATNAYGSDGETKTGYISVTTAPSYTVITYDNFETGMGSFTDGGTDCIRLYNTTYAHQGSYSIDIQDNTTTSLFSTTTGRNVSSYTNMEVSFWFKASSMETGEDFWVQYWDGAAWRIVATFRSGYEFSNGVFYNKTVTIPKGTYAYPTAAKIRFRCDASNDYDDVCIDEVEWRGYSGTAKVATLPDGFGLSQNYPNPFNPTTTIDFSLPWASDITLEVFNVLGQRVAVLADGRHEAGKHTVTWDASRVSTGVYLYRLQAGDLVQTRKMLLMK